MSLLASDGWRVPVDVGRVVSVDPWRRGAVAVRVGRGTVRRAEPGPAGALVYEARGDGAGVALEVWGPPATPSADAEAALHAARGWAGLHDDPAGFAEVALRHPVLTELALRLGTPLLSRLPRVAEAVGRAVVAQLVQGVEAGRSIARVSALLGTPVPAALGSGGAGGLWTWPTAAAVGATPAWRLRPCGVSLRGVRALHAAAVADDRLTEAAAAADWPLLDRLLRGLPGVGAWTSAETRLALGDADAVSVGDYHLPSVIGTALAGPRRGGRGAWTDADLLEVLAPFAPHRGRVIRLLESAAVRGLVPRPARRAPRAALSAHRYW